MVENYGYSFRIWISYNYLTFLSLIERTFQLWSMGVDEDMKVEEGGEVGSGSSDADSQFAHELRDAIAQQMWDVY